MLLRSASSPILNSWLSHLRESTPETEMMHQIHKPWHLTLSASSSSSFSSIIGDSAKKLNRALSETDLSFSVKKSYPRIINGFPEVDEEGESIGFCYIKTASVQKEYFANSVLQGGRDNEVDDVGPGILFADGKDGGGGSICGGSRGDRSDGGDDGGNDGADLYYQKMIEANPGDSLLLGNYARFLKEVRGDLVKAEKYCGRAILSNPGDGNILSMYAELMWKSHKDATRAENYFDQAVKASPNDCYVLGSYARFLWESEEEKEEEISEEKASSSSFQSYGVDPQKTPLAAAS